MKFLLQFLLYTVLFSTAFSQNIHYRLKAGYSSSTVVINGHKPFESLFSPTGGMTVDFPVKNRFLCQTGLMYFHEGDTHKQTYSTTPTGPVTFHKFSANLNYLCLPVFAGYNLKDKMHFFLGPQLGYLLSAIEKQEGYPSRSPEYYRKFDFSAVASAEYKLIKNFGIYADYSYGISKIMKGVVVDNTGTVTGFKYFGNNRTFFVGIFYEGFVLGK